MDELTTTILALIITGVILWISLKELVYRARILAPERLPSVVLITGAASGIGKEMALSLTKRAIDARRSMTLVLWDIDENGLQVLERQIRDLSGSTTTITTTTRGPASSSSNYSIDVIAIQCNVADETAVAQCAQLVKTRLSNAITTTTSSTSNRDTSSTIGVDTTAATAVGAGAGEKYVDMVINNAGIVTGKRFLDAPAGAIERTFAVNVFAHFYVLRQFLPEMIRRNRGRVVTIASTCSFFGAPTLTDYCASKFAVLGFHESLRLELRKEDRLGVKTTIVHPNAINTGMFDGIKLQLQWLVPLLEPRAVADAVIDGALAEKESVVLPWVVARAAPMVRVMPNTIRDFAMDIFGASTGMDTFVGRVNKVHGD